MIAQKDMWPIPRQIKKQKQNQKASVGSNQYIQVFWNFCFFHTLAADQLEYLFYSIFEAQNLEQV